MFTHPRRLLAAGVITASALAVPAVAMAAGSSPSSGPTKSRAAASASAGAGKSGAPLNTATLAASAGLSDSQLQTGLAAAKMAGGNGAAGVAAFAAATGVLPATAGRILGVEFGFAAPSTVGKSATPADFGTALAAQLQVSTSAARAAMRQLDRLSGAKGGVDPGSTAFAAVAHGLGVSPHELAAGLDAVKRSLSGR